jgi:hypothetical protein
MNSYIFCECECESNSFIEETYKYMILLNFEVNLEFSLSYGFRSQETPKN